MPYALDHLEFQQDVLPLIYGQRSVDDFVVTAMKLLPRLVNSEITSYNEVNFEAKRVKTIMDSSDALVLYHRDSFTFDRLLIEDNPLVAYLMRDASQPKKISDFLHLDSWKATTIHRRFYGRLDLDHQIAMVLTVKKPVLVAFALNRSREDFNEEERSLLQLLQPHLTKAYETTILLETMENRLANQEAMLDALNAGWIDLDASLNVTHVSQVVAQTLDEFFPDNARPETKLPDELRHWIALQLQTSGDPMPSEPFILEAEAGCLKVTLVRASTTMSIGLMVERSAPRLVPFDLKQLGLTARQTEVLFWIAQGKSNADIAVILKISRKTVENHVSHILDGLEVENRTEAAKAALALNRM